MTEPVQVTVTPPPPVEVTVTVPAPVEVTVATGVPIPVPGPPGTTGVAYPVTAVSSWNQAHVLPYPPMVHLADQDGRMVLISAEYPDSTHVFVTFPAPFTGTIILS